MAVWWRGLNSQFCVVGVLVVALSGADQYRKINNVRQWEKQTVGLMRKWRVAVFLWHKYWKLCQLNGNARTWLCNYTLSYTEAAAYWWYITLHNPERQKLVGKTSCKSTYCQLIDKQDKREVNEVGQKIFTWWFWRCGVDGLKHCSTTSLSSIFAS